MYLDKTDTASFSTALSWYTAPSWHTASLTVCSIGLLTLGHIQRKDLSAFDVTFDLKVLGVLLFDLTLVSQLRGCLTLIRKIWGAEGCTRAPHAWSGLTSAWSGWIGSFSFHSAKIQIEVKCSLTPTRYFNRMRPKTHRLMQYQGNNLAAVMCWSRESYSKQGSNERDSFFLEKHDEWISFCVRLRGS